MVSLPACLVFVTVDMRKASVEECSSRKAAGTRSRRKPQKQCLQLKRPEHTTICFLTAAVNDCLDIWLSKFKSLPLSKHWIVLKAVWQRILYKREVFQGALNHYGFLDKIGQIVL